jgi:hypothetical protein
MREKVTMTWLWISLTCLAHDQLFGKATHTAWTGITSFCALILDNYRMEKDTNFISKVSYRIFYMTITAEHWILQYCAQSTCVV